MSKTQMIASPRIQIPHFARNFNIELQSPRCIDFHLEPLTPNSISTLKSPAQNIFRKASRHVSEKLPALDYKSRTSLVSSRASFDDHAKLRNAAETPRGETTKISAKQNGCVKAYAASTNSGLVRGYNEDRVSIINNILKPAERVGENWPKCSFFAVYDGHGGSTCADFLRDNLHQYIIKDPSFPENPKIAIKNGCLAAEKAYLEQCQARQTEKSGSCAIIAVIVGDNCFIANVGDSRAVMSAEAGVKVHGLSRDHKPCDESERIRILQAGGKVYQTPVYQAQKGDTPILGPVRVMPGRLSVSRTFGDIEAKLTQYGGNPRVVIATPEIKSFKVTRENDFLLLASDGIFDKLNNREVINCAWNSLTDSRSADIHHRCGIIVEGVIRTALNKRTMDNVTVVVIAFSGFKKLVRESLRVSPCLI